MLRRGLEGVERERGKQNTQTFSNYKLTAPPKPS